jgi:hypothetical protein
MSKDLGRLECRICGRSIYFPPAETAMMNGERLIELTCSKGHTDSYWDVESEQLEKVGPHAEQARFASIGF